MKRTFAIIKAAVMLIVAILGIVVVVGFSSPESRWSGPSIAVMAFASLFVAICVWFLVDAIRKGPPPEK